MAADSHYMDDEQVPDLHPDSHQRDADLELFPVLCNAFTVFIPEKIRSSSSFVVEAVLPRE
jgi:hypothetical protein